MYIRTKRTSALKARRPSGVTLIHSETHKVIQGRKRKGKAGRKARVPASAPDHDSDHDDSRSCAQSPASALAPAVQDAAIAEHPETAPELDDASEPTPPRQKKRKIVPPKRKVKPSAKARAAKDDGNGDELGNNIESSDDSEEDREEYVQYLTTNPKSPFATMDLIAEFAKPTFWDNISAERKKVIADMLPDHINFDADGRLPLDYIKYDPDFRDGVRQMQNHLAAGQLDPAWIAEAEQARKERAEGKFDQWKEEQFEEFWGQKQKVDPKALAGQSSTVKLNRLVEAGLFQAGDVFSYSRIFGQGKNRTLVEKDCKLLDIDGETLTFAIPPGKAKFARRLKEDRTTSPTADDNAPASPGGESAISSIPSDVEDMVPFAVSSLAALEEKIVAVDGGFKGKVNGNAWKCTRVKRNNQDIGSLFEIREEHFVYKGTK